MSIFVANFLVRSILYQHGSGAGLESDFDLFWPDLIGAGLGFSARPDRIWIVMSRDCQLKSAMSYVRTPLSFKSKRKIELLIYNPF